MELPEEIEAIVVIIAALNRFDERTQRRILDYLWDRYVEHRPIAVEQAVVSDEA